MVAPSSVLSENYSSAGAIRPSADSADNLLVPNTSWLHIKPRRDCTEEERRDPNVAMLACLMGCDAAFENGDLRVFGDGAMSVTPELRTARPEWAARFQGARAAIYSDSNAEYFAARRGN